MVVLIYGSEGMGMMRKGKRGVDGGDGVAVVMEGVMREGGVVF